MKSVPYYKRDISYYIEKNYLENRGFSLDLLSDFIVRDFKQKYITEADEKLIKFVLQKNVSQENFDKFIEEWDIEAEGGHKALMLSYFMKLHPDLKYPEYIEPRLKGLFQFYRFGNLKLIGHFKKVCTRLKEDGIEVLIIKGGAMRHYRPEIPRQMGDIDILVREDDYEKCKDIVKELCYTFKEFKHSIDLHEDESDNGILDIHRRISMVSKNEGIINDDLFARANKEKVFGVEDILVSSYEDTMFISLVNMIKNLMRYTSIPSVLYTIADCEYLINKPDFDWNIVKQNAIKTKTENQIHIAIKFINEFVSQKLPEIFEKEFNESSIMYLYNECFIQNLRQESHKLTLKDIFKTIITYIGFRPQYLIYKRRTIRENPKMAKFVLEKQRLIK